MTEQRTVAAVRERIADLADGGPEDVAFAGRLIRSFVDRVPAMLAELSTAMLADDAALVAHRAHALKGATSNVGAVNVAELCAEVELRAEAGQLSAIREYPARIGAELPRALRILDEALACLGPL